MTKPEWCTLRVRRAVFDRIEADKRKIGEKIETKGEVVARWSVSCTSETLGTGLGHNAEVMFCLQGSETSH